MPDKTARIRAILKSARAGTRRHPAEVTSDRLGDAVERWNEDFTPKERDMVSHIRDRLEQIAEEAVDDA